MSYQSVISHQPRSPFRAIRADYVAICNGAKDAVCAALLLDLAEAWTNHKLSKIEDENLEGVEIQEDLWFYRSEEKIKADLFDAYGINKLRDNRHWLVENKFLQCQQVPRKEGGFTHLYRLNVEFVQQMLDELPPVKNNGRSEQEHPPKITGASVKNNAIRDIDKKEIKKSDADILATLFNVVPQTQKDWKFWGNIVKDLKAAGILSSDYTAYLSWIKKQSAAQGNWAVTPTSLTNASRPSLYISEKENKAKSPARASLSFEYMQDTRSEAQARLDAEMARAAMERGES